jgi:epoxyqueuosine reductase
MVESSRHILSVVGEKVRTKTLLMTGIAALDSLKKTPSYATCGAVEWPVDAKSVFVIALAHPSQEPGLDWWDAGTYGTPGNRRMVRITLKIKQLLESRWNIRGRGLPYHVENGGVFLKDAAVLAGIGAVGKNNLLVIPGIGPRVRLRALFLDTALEQTGPVLFDPCKGCPQPCRSACPQNAFAEGRYSRKRCSKQMAADAAAPQTISRPQLGRPPLEVIQYCRACELACVVGK